VPVSLKKIAAPKIAADPPIQRKWSTSPTNNAGVMVMFLATPILGFLVRPLSWHGYLLAGVSVP
jgi:hypothetical protein